MKLKEQKGERKRESGEIKKKRRGEEGEKEKRKQNRNKENKRLLWWNNLVTNFPRTLIFQSLHFCFHLVKELHGSTAELPNRSPAEAVLSPASALPQYHAHRTGCDHS